MKPSICSECGHNSSKCSRSETYWRAIELIQLKKSASAALLQRDLKISYAAASQVLEDLESDGLVGPSDGKNSRSINI